MIASEIMTLQQIQDALKDRRLYVVAKETGLTYPTIKKMADGKELNYTLNTIKAVSKYLSDKKRG